VQVYDTKPHSLTNPTSPRPLSPADDCQPGPSSVVDLTDLTSYSPSYTCSPQSGDELPEIALSCKQSVVTTDDLYHIFTPTFSKPCVDAIVKLSSLDRTAAMNFLLSGPTARGLLQLLRQREYNSKAEITIQDEDELLEALLHYKHPSFKPLSPVRVSFKGQPAIDTGGVTRQFFSDVLRCFVTQDVFQLFVGHPERRRPAYSPQVLPLMKILGLIIGHSLVHEGPGFPFLAPFVFWYLASGSEQIALLYVSVNDLSTPVMQIVIQVKKLFPLCACTPTYYSTQSSDVCGGVCDPFPISNVYL